VSANYRRAAAHVSKGLRALGYDVREQRVPMPAGTSWGVKVPGGHTTNVIADPPGFDATAPHVVVGAHLDTVPQAPGAEDDASGVAVTLELARMLRQQPAALPVRLVVFGGEEARGGGGTLYAFGSRFLVRSLTPDQRDAIVGMVALDRVGVRAQSAPVCQGDRGPGTLAAAIRAAARDAGLATTECHNRASDHVSFEAVGVPVARLGSVPYAAYHSSADVPSVVDRRQLARSGNVVWAWLRSLGP
jgi:Zn-dependent M28 family amino/carboxypeptidase